jgi:hypothetical protein
MSNRMATTATKSTPGPPVARKASRLPGLESDGIKVRGSAGKRLFKARYMAELDGFGGANKIALVSFLSKIIFRQKSETADIGENRVHSMSYLRIVAQIPDFLVMR